MKTYKVVTSIFFLFLTLAFLGSCSNDDSSNSTGNSIRFIEDDDEVYQPQISVMHAESVSVSDVGDGIYRFTLKNLDP